jgi:hypothetical protein
MHALGPGQETTGGSDASELAVGRNADDTVRHGLSTVLHFAGSPVAFMANFHCAAAIPSFVALEHHGLDIPFWRELITGLSEDYMEDGHAVVPDAPGLGVELNLPVIEANLRSPSGLFERTDEWNTPKLGFWQPGRGSTASGRGDLLDSEEGGALQRAESEEGFVHGAASATTA